MAIDKVVAFAARRSSLRPALSTASLVLRYGGDEAQRDAALLHPCLTETETTPTSLDELSREFGEETARLTEAFAFPELDFSAGQPASSHWRAVREAYLAKLEALDERALLPVACKALHEATELLHDLRYDGVTVWKRYPVPYFEIGWYFRGLLSVLYRALPAERHRGLVGELGRNVRELSLIVFENKPC